MRNNTDQDGFPDLAALNGSTHRHIAGTHGKRLDEARQNNDALISLDMLEGTILFHLTTGTILRPAMMNIKVLP